jgi:hypothetical protein
MGSPKSSTCTFLLRKTLQLAQLVGPQHAFADVGFVARTNALMNLSCTSLLVSCATICERQRGYQVKFVASLVRFDSGNIDSR